MLWVKISHKDKREEWRCSDMPFVAQSCQMIFCGDMVGKQGNVESYLMKENGETQGLTPQWKQWGFSEISLSWKFCKPRVVWVSLNGWWIGRLSRNPEEWPQRDLVLWQNLHQASPMHTSYLSPTPQMVSMEKQSEYSEPENETFWWKIVHFWLDIFSLNFWL